MQPCIVIITTFTIASTGLNLGIKYKMHIPDLNYQYPSSNILSHNIVFKPSNKLFMKVNPSYNSRVSKVLKGLRFILSFCYYTGCTPFKLTRAAGGDDRYYLHTNRIQKVKFAIIFFFKKYQ